jgi:hypothetical protein
MTETVNATPFKANPMTKRDKNRERKIELYLNRQMFSRKAGIFIDNAMVIKI